MQIPHVSSDAAFLFSQHGHFQPSPAAVAMAALLTDSDACVLSLPGSCLEGVKTAEGDGRGTKHVTQVLDESSLPSSQHGHFQPPAAGIAGSATGAAKTDLAPGATAAPLVPKEKPPAAGVVDLLSEPKAKPLDVVATLVGASAGASAFSSPLSSSREYPLPELRLGWNCCPGAGAGFTSGTFDAAVASGSACPNLYSDGAGRATQAVVSVAAAEAPPAVVASSVWRPVAVAASGTLAVCGTGSVPDEGMAAFPSVASLSASPVRVSSSRDRPDR
mmetsp:Transcript_4843/g.13564  ORF Transcript_4843/g.13564 Transcript_4843/m.13564 type:complete len:275 (+) Transcript_4843:2285-3109(+)